jgi:hypothetical protein
VTGRRVRWYGYLVALLVAAAGLAMVYAIVTTVTSGKSIRNDPEVKGEVVARFAEQSWSSDILAAHVGADGLDLFVAVDSSIADDSGVVLDMCVKLTEVVAERFSDRGSLFITDMDGNIIATNFLGMQNKCYWRGG